MERIVIEKDTADAASAECKKLFDDALAQLEEHKMYITLQLDGMTDEQWVAIYGNAPKPGYSHHSHVLRDEVNQLALGAIRIEPGITEGGAPTVSVVYEWPDMLYEFLRHPQTPEALQKCLWGGVPLDDVELTRVEPADEHTRKVMAERRNKLRRGNRS